MLLTDIKFDTTEVAMLIGTCRETVNLWCKKKKIKFYKKPNSKRFFIKGKDFAEFLYKNPRYQSYFLNSRPCKQTPSQYKRKPDQYYEMVRNMVKKYLLVQPPIYLTSDIADIFCVTYDAVKNWMRNRWIIPIKYKPTYGENLFNQKSIRDFLEKCPRYKVEYENYLKRKGEINYGSN